MRKWANTFCSIVARHCSIVCCTVIQFINENPPCLNGKFVHIWPFCALPNDFRKKIVKFSSNFSAIYFILWNKWLIYFILWNKWHLFHSMKINSTCEDDLEDLTLLLHTYNPHITMPRPYVICHTLCHTLQHAHYFTFRLLWNKASCVTVWPTHCGRH